jgi:dTDP-4-dehydrorhamnose 3,5-epimerase-like enzyme
LSERYRRISLPQITDARGSLMFAEETRHIPFAVKRIFAIYDVPEGGARGGHAHRVQEQFLMMAAGGCSILIDDGADRSEVRLEGPTEGLYIPAGLWLELRNFSARAVCVVLASGRYDESDYIRDYREFLACR